MAVSTPGLPDEGWYAPAIVAKREIYLGVVTTDELLAAAEDRPRLSAASTCR